MHLVPRRIHCHRLNISASKCTYLRKKLAAYIASILPIDYSSAELGAKISGSRTCVLNVSLFLKGMFPELSRGVTEFWRGFDVPRHIFAA